MTFVIGQALKRLCTQFSHFFIKKLERIRLEIETRLYTTRPSLPRLCRAPTSVTLSEFSAVTEEELSI